MNIMSGDLLSTNCADCNFLHQVIRTKYKHITLAATIIVFLCVLFSWPEEYTLSTVGRAGVISNESIPTVKVPTTEFLTYASLAAVFPDVLTRADYPAGFFDCSPDQSLKTLRSAAGLDRYKACSSIIYNRVPKCGSRTILHVMQILSQQHNFSLISIEPYDTVNYFRNITKLVEFGQQFSKLQQPVIYSQHIHFVNFTQLGFPPPVYINVVREPTERLISHYFYNKYGSMLKPSHPTSNQTLDECVRSGDPDPCLYRRVVLPYFCGQTEECRLTSQSSLQRAKQALHSDYLLVGLTEDIPGFLHTLESLLPGFFTNATQVFDKVGLAFKNITRTVHKPTVGAETRQAIKDLIPFQYEFYLFAKQRFYAIRDRVDALRAGTMV